MRQSGSIQDVTDELPSISVIIETLAFRAGHNTSMVIAGTTLLGLAAGVIGVFALLRKRSLMTDALSHATLPGITLAFLFAGAIGVEAKSLPVLLLGAVATGVLGVICIQLILDHTRLREDAAIGIVLSVFFGAGIVGMSFIQRNAPSDSGGLNHFIYGQAATMQPPDVILMALIAFSAIMLTMLFLKEFAIVCFNDAFARVDGWSVSFIDLLMMGLVVVVTVAGLQAVGLILVVSMLIIPPVAARFWTDRLSLLILFAGVIGMLSGYFGSVTSALFPRKPAGAVIVLCASTLLILSMLFAPKRGVVAMAIRRLRVKLRVAGDHLLEMAYEHRKETLSQSELADLAALQGWSVPFRAMLLRQLRAEKLIHADRRAGIVLTRLGVERGARVWRNHTLWEQYLISYADIAPSHVDWSVDLVEHVLSDHLVQELESALVTRGVPLPRYDKGFV